MRKPSLAISALASLFEQRQRRHELLLRRPRAGFAVFVLFWLLASTGQCSAQAKPDQPLQPLIDAATRSYQMAQASSERLARLAHFETAATQFSQAAQLAQQSGNARAALYANAGTAWLQAEQLGRSVLAYQRALSIDPSHRQAHSNLAYIRTLLPSWVPERTEPWRFQSLPFLPQTLTHEQRALIAAAMFLAAALAFGFSLRWRFPMLRTFAILATITWLALLIPTLSTEATNSAVVIDRDGLVVRASDSNNAPARLPQPLPDGTQLQLLEERSGWARIRLGDGHEGWVRRSGIERVAITAEV